MKQTQLSLLLISIGSLCAILSLKVAATDPLTANGSKKRAPAQTFATRNVKLQQPQSSAQRALLTSIGHLEQPALHRSEHLLLAKTIEYTHKRRVRATNDADEDYNEDVLPWKERPLGSSHGRSGVEAEMDAHWLVESFGQMWQSLVEWVELCIAAICKLFTADDNANDDGNDDGGS